MIIRFALALSLLAAAPLAAQTAAPVPAPAEGVVKVALDTSAGRIVLALDKAHAPLTTANFLKYVDSGRFDGESFYRSMKFTGGGGIIQGGITSDARKLNAPVAFESSERTGIQNKAGAIAMADFEPGKAQADFFIETTDIPAFDGAQGFAAFGQVIEGMEVVKKILAAPVSPTKGEGPMKGQMLDPPVTILKVERVKG